MFHIEIDYGDGGEPTLAQYSLLLDLDVEAYKLTHKYLIIVPHIEGDRGLADGHMDPQNFDYNHFYSVHAEKGVNIREIEKFDHNRYCGDDSHKVPFASDKFNRLSILKGNLHQ